jgi:arsenate reductase
MKGFAAAYFPTQRRHRLFASSSYAPTPASVCHQRRPYNNKLGDSTFMKSTYTIYHNPRCTKSRGALALLEEHGIEPKIIEYLQTPPTTAELKSILKKLGMKADELIRKGEDVYKEKIAGRSLTEDQLIAAMVKDPILIERPIVIHGDRAVVGRPVEKVEALLSK